jgi:hypothetical protein
MHCKWKEHLFMGYDGMARDIVQYEFMSHLFLHTRYSQACLLTVSLTNGLDYLCNLELCFLLSAVFRQKLALIALRQGWRVLSLRFERAECCVVFECLGRLLDMHEILGSDLGTETRYLVTFFFFCGVLHHLEANSGMVSYFQSCYGRILPCLYSS